VGCIRPVGCKVIPFVDHFTRNSIIGYIKCIFFFFVSLLDVCSFKHSLSSIVIYTSLSALPQFVSLLFRYRRAHCFAFFIFTIRLRFGNLLTSLPPFSVANPPRTVKELHIFTFIYEQYYNRPVTHVYEARTLLLLVV